MSRQLPPIQASLLSYGMSGRVFHAPLLDMHHGFRLRKICERSPKGSHKRYPEGTWERLNTELEGLHVIGQVESQQGNYSAYYEQLHRAIRQFQEPPVSAESARDVIRIIELAYESSREEKVVWVFT